MTGHETLAEAAEKLRALYTSGLFKFVGVPLRKQVESVTHWVEMLVTGRAPKHTRTHLLRSGAQSFLLLLACGCGLQGVLHWSEGLTKLCSMVLLSGLKMIELVSLQPFPIYSWLMTVEQSKYIEQLASRGEEKYRL